MPLDSSESTRAQRQLSNSLASSRKDSVTKSGDDQWDARLTYSRWWAVAFSQVYISLIWRLVDTRHGIIVKIRLFNYAVMGGNEPPSRNAGGKNSCSLELPPYVVWVDDGARVYSSVDS